MTYYLQHEEEALAHSKERQGIYKTISKHQEGKSYISYGI